MIECTMVCTADGEPRQLKNNTQFGLWVIPNKKVSGIGRYFIFIRSELIEKRTYDKHELMVIGRIGSIFEKNGVKAIAIYTHKLYFLDASYIDRNSIIERDKVVDVMPGYME